MVDKNLCNKTVNVETPYEIWETLEYQKPSKEVTNPYARWYCAVKSPYTYDTYDYGDVYVADIVNRVDTCKRVI